MGRATQRGPSVSAGLIASGSAGSIATGCCTPERPPILMCSAGTGTGESGVETQSLGVQLIPGHGGAPYVDELHDGTARVGELMEAEVSAEVGAGLQEVAQETRWCIAMGIASGCGRRGRD